MQLETLRNIEQHVDIAKFFLTKGCKFSYLEVNDGSLNL